jgi:hypothetical protein
VTIEEYLAALRRELRAWPLRKRRIMREIEGHLLDAAQTLESSGMPHAAAVEAAIERLGPIQDVAESFENARPNRSRLALAGAEIALASAGVTLLGGWLGGITFKSTESGGKSALAEMIPIVDGQTSGITVTPRTGRYATVTCSGRLAAGGTITITSTGSAELGCPLVRIVHVRR